MSEQLSDWTVNYVKNKDLTFRKLVNHKLNSKNNSIEFEFKDKVVSYFILEKLSDKLFELIKDREHKIAVCFNDDDNFKFMIKNWEKLSDVRNLSLLFVNLKINDKWIINPHTHSMIADPSSIEAGLRTMFDTANGKIAEIKGKKKKASMFEEKSSEEEEEEMDEEK